MSQLHLKTSFENSREYLIENSPEISTENIDNIPTDTWFTASWDEFFTMIKNPIYDKAKCYYYQGEFRLEMSPTGYKHSWDHSIINYCIHLFANIKKIPLNGHNNCSYGKKGSLEIQPDLSYNIGEKVDAIPGETTIVNLEEYPVPNLVIEIANTF